MEYVKLNNNDDNLSLGNLFRIIKEESKNKSGALQVELFCTLFEIENINNTTVNNYCVGSRSINDEYKQLIINKNKKYEKNKNEYINNILGIISIMEGKIILDKNIEFINNNYLIQNINKKMFNISKNDKSVSNEFENKIKELINNKNNYECIIEIINYAVLSKKQPVYMSELKKELIENILNDTNISTNDLCEYLNLKLKESINYDYNLKLMAKKGNSLANFELGSNYYCGLYGKIDYEKAYYYFLDASKKNHAGSLYMLGQMFLKGYVGGKTNDDLFLAYNYLKESALLGNVSALNKIGNMYLNGVYPLKKDINKAITYYEKAIKYDYVYAYNNLGKIYEKANNYEKAIMYYEKAANLGESWALNKMGEYYRIKGDMNKAFDCYEKALDNNEKDICYYAYYNLAKYFYLNGYKDIVLIKDEKKAKKYFEIASKHGINKDLVDLTK